MTIGSPPDRITTPTNAFSIGAVNATHYDWPYPIASWSSRGPSGCDGVTKKPEVCAPGVDVYSSVPGGGYEQTGWSGTSMAGPHVAGIVALMREANPDLDVDTIKEIIMATAADYGAGGETYGWGFVDAYEAVVSVMGGYGTLTGTVTNASNGGTPVAGATVELIEIEREVTTLGDGTYAISVPVGTYTVTASHPSFEPQTFYDIVIDDGGTTVLDFALTDIGAPEITNTTEHRSTEDTVGPYLIETTIDDYSAMDHVTLYYRLNGGAFSGLDMTIPTAVEIYSAGIPGQSQVTFIEYYVDAADVAMNSATDPPGAPADVYGFYVAPIVELYDDDMESGQGNWTHDVVLPGFNDQWHLSTQRNHTPDGDTSWKCGDTGAESYTNLLDAGLVSEPVELGIDSYLHYWQWVDAESSNANPGYAYDGGLVEISVEGGDWVQIHPEGGYPFLAREGSTPGPFPAGTPFFSGLRDWHEVHFNLSALEGNVQFRFRFGSDGAEVREGWYVDDVIVDGFQIDVSGLEEGARSRVLWLQPADPNPFTRGTTLRYGLPSGTDVLLQIFDPTGRIVRTLVAGPQEAGFYEVHWDGRDDRARPLASGVYLTRLQAGHAQRALKMILTR
jgi:hypothetical protein